MLIPLYVLVGVWGGARRQAATVTFVIYTMAGLAADARVDRRVRRLAGDVLPDRLGDERQRAGSSSASRRVRGQGAALPVPRLAAARLPRGAGRSRGASSPASSRRPRSTASCGSDRRSSPSRPTTLRASSSCSPRAGLVYGSLLAFRAPDLRGVIAYSSMAQMGLITLGVFAVRRPRARRRHAPVGHPRPHLREHVPARRDGRAALRDGRARRARRAWREGGPMLATVVHRRGDDRARRAGLGDVRGRVPDPGRRLRARAGATRSSVALGIVLAAMYTLRLISAILHVKPGTAVRDEALDLRPGELGARPAAASRPPRPLGLAGARQPERVPGQRRGSRRSRRRSSDRHADRRLARALADARAARRVRRRAARRGARPRLDAQARSRRSVALVGFVARGRARRRRLRRDARRREVLLDESMARDRLAALAQVILARDRRRRRARLLGRAAPRQPRRVLRAARRGRRRDGLLRQRREPDDAVPRARVVLDLPLHPRARSTPSARPRSRRGSST